MSLPASHDDLFEDIADIFLKYKSNLSPSQLEAYLCGSICAGAAKVN